MRFLRFHQPLKKNALDTKESTSWNQMSSYGGIAAINRSPSVLGFKPKGDSIMAVSIFFKACKKGKVTDKL